MSTKHMEYSTLKNITLVKPDALVTIAKDQGKKDGGLRLKGLYKASTREKPLISVITIVLNGARHLEQTIQSVLTQSYDNIEYVVLDAGSTDGSLDIIRKYGYAIDFWMSQRDKGISDGMNKGLSLCTGDYIGMIHADDWYEPDTVEKIVQSGYLGKAGVICGLMRMWYDAGKSCVFESKPELLKKMMAVNHPTCFVSKDAYRTYGNFLCDFKYGMDYELMLRFFLKGVEFHSMDSVLANMRSGGNSATLKSLKDGHRARLLLEPDSFFSSKAFYLFGYLRSYVGQLCQAPGLAVLREFYRKYFAEIKKY